MFKKFFAVFFFAATLLIIGQSSDAEASWIRIGTYSDGTPAFLGTHTIAGGRGNFSCDVRAGGAYIHYNFWYAGGGPYYRNSWPAEGYVYGSGSPVAIRIWEYVNG